MYPGKWETGSLSNEIVTFVLFLLRSVIVARIVDILYIIILHRNDYKRTDTIL